jgi:hypothetical protein
MPKLGGCLLGQEGEGRSDRHTVAPSGSRLQRLGSSAGLKDTSSPDGEPLRSTASAVGLHGGRGATRRSPLGSRDL